MPTGTGVALELAAGTPTPLLGAAVVLPISPALAGGYLGVVEGVSGDGRTLLLRAGAISDAFDDYALDVDSFTTGYPEGTPPEDDGEVTAGASSKSSLKAAAAPKASCGGGSGGMDIVFNPGIDFDGHYRTVVDKYSFLGKEIPVGASVDFGLSATFTGAASVRANAVYKCKLNLKKIFQPISTTPVPLSLYAAPVAEIGVGGALEVQNVGFRTTAGFSVQGTLSLKKGADIGGDSFADTQELTPTIIENGLVQLKVGGETVVGPGTGTEKAGVIVGLGGELLPIDASFAPGFAEQDERRNFCTIVKGAATFQLFLGVKALLGKWSFSEKITVEALKVRREYPGSPYYFPAKCTEFPAEETPDSLLGDGVEQVDDTVEGSDEQWDKVDGFVPGESTWVLSTGKVSSALGEPGDFASTGLGTPGSTELSALSGRPTFDAASYVVTLKPTGDTLHVDYVFASEEYPEYVGSQFNDVMAVFVDGKNCATVPGSGEAVSINTINQFRNSHLYVDNSKGAAGYGTSMDGLTRPLTCTVPVTPGKAVTVRIAVADASDSAYDSAVALIDGGIYSD